MKRKLRESSGAVKFKEYMTKQETTEEKILEILTSDICKVNQAPSVNDQAAHVNQPSTFTVGATISVIDDMVNNGLMTKDELWCFEISLLEDALKREIFMSLSDDAISKYGLKSSDKMPGIEKLGVFLYTLALGKSNRDAGERFQRSGETISRVFHEVLEDCIGSIDGTHIQACIPESKQIPYIGRKGVPTFNVMATCDFDMCFTFVSVGWEESAHDTRVFLHAINTPSMNFPNPTKGRYYLVDKRYPFRQGYLVSYSKTRYHLSQFENEPPNNMQEAFNRSHSSLGSCIKRSFGVLKKRWKILQGMPQFSVKTQIDVIIATFALHNYIRNNSKDDMLFTRLEQHPNFIPQDELHDVRGHYTNNGESFEGTSNVMKQIRNDIATLIWNARAR
uniref:uncharacterized protein LOC122610130 n=1 Tax=Erigeron canadensis TaxID=72917 RepID=UPI001CB90F27|nr:uncharacterized protein LOC122610130 [Erigeron canadensis]